MALINQKPIVPDPQQIAEEIEANAMLDKAVNWLGKQFKIIRTWVHTDGRTYAAVTHSAADPGNGVHKDPMDVADAILAAKANTGEFATFQLKYGNNQNASARLIKANRERNELILALDVEYTVNAVSSSITAFAAKKANVAANVGQVEIGFGAF